MADTVEVLINADVASWGDPNPVPNQPPVYRSAFRGETVTMPAGEAERLSRVMVRRHYPAPAGGPGATQARDEPAVLDPNAPKAEADEREAMSARIAELEAELARMRAELPPAPPAPPTPAAVAGVSLPPSVTGVRLPPNVDVGVAGTIGVTADAPGPGVTVEDSTRFSSMTVEETVTHLNQHPEDVDAIAAAENSRPRPRTGVLEAVEAIRDASTS